MTAIAAGLATATVTLPPIATPSVTMKGMGVSAFILLGLSAWSGINAAKLYVAFGLGDDAALAALFGDDPQTVETRRAKALKSGSKWALRQQVLFALGGLTAGVFLIANLLQG